MKEEQPPAKEDPDTAIERALRELLVDEPKVKVDPTTGQVISRDGEKSSLTDPEGDPRIG